MKLIAIGGEPGSGKTTLMKRVVEHYNLQPKFDEVKLVPYHQNQNVYVLGKYEEAQVFAGTDRMSMAVQPEAIKFLTTLADTAVVLYEGDRLFTASFLESCVENYDTKIIYLSTDRSVRQERYKERGSEQDETWLRGRESKIANILTNFTLMFHTEKFPNNTKEEQDKIFEHLIFLIEGK
jgi:uridine kinase